MTDDLGGLGGRSSAEDGLIEIDLNFESMRRFQAEFSPNLSKDGLFIDTAEPLSPGSVVRFRVILPEEFVFLEGTAVVEWVRPAETATDGAPGMALRFVTLSPQNQELVEQLVQDFIDSGGSPFDLDVRPVPSDFPTDALEGAPPAAKAAEEDAYRLTVRRTGPRVQEEALRALSEAAPDAPADVGGDDGRGFEIVADAGRASEAPPPPEQDELPLGDATLESADATMGDAIEERLEEIVGKPRGREPAGVGVKRTEETVGAALDAMVATPAEPVPERTTGGDAEPEVAEETREVSEPPELEWPDEIDDVEVGGDGPPEVPEPEPEPEAEPEPPEAPAPPPEPTETAPAPSPPQTAESDVLPTPAEFDGGPEVIGDVGGGLLGGTAFDVSLPESDDGPDTTPVMPDRGDNDVTVTDDEEDGGEGGARRLWPMAAIAAAAVVVVALAVSWPRIAEWFGGSGEGAASTEGVAVVVEDEGGASAPDELPPTTGNATAESAAAGETASSATLAVDASAAVDASDRGPESVAAEGGSTTVDQAVPAEPEPEAAVALPRADTVTDIEVGPGAGGTTLRIRANGGLGDGVISMEKLASPPRVLVRVRGIVNPYRPYTVDGGTAEVTQARIGLHEERRPPELWIVVDLADPEVVIRGVDIQDGVAEMVLAGG